MRVICPECNLEDEVDPSSVTPDTRFVCARCSTSYEVFPREETDTNAETQCEPEAEVEMASTQDVEVVSDQREAQSNEPLLTSEEISSTQAEEEEEMAVLEALFMNSSADEEEDKEEGCAQAEQLKVEEQKAVALLDSETPDRSVSPEEERSKIETINVPADRYTEGVRLMRVSPTRLFMGGASFVALIVVCNLIVSPVLRTGKTSGGAMAELSQSSNQSSNRGVRRAESEPVRTVAYVQEIQATPTPTPRPVVVEPTPAPTPEATPAPKTIEPVQANTDGRFTVQVGSYNEPGQAEERAATLRAAGFDARVVQAQIPNRGTWYRVQTGRFPTRDEATRYGAQIRAKGASDAAVVTEVQ